MHNERQIDRVIYAEIAERRLQPDASRTDILSLMMAARDRSPYQNQYIQANL